MPDYEYDVAIIGAGLGGLLSAAQFLSQGKRVLIVERLSHVGGRFTAKTFHGAQVSTGAVHMLPFGSNGIVAAMLRELHVQHAVVDAELFGSFFVRGHHIHVRSLLAFERVVGLRQFGTMVKLGAAMVQHPAPDEETITFAEWLQRRKVTADRFPELVRFFERVSHFTLSVDLDQVLYPEIVETFKNMLRYGPPGIVKGGCAAIAHALEHKILEHGGTILLEHDVRQITSCNGHVTGIQIVHRTQGTETVVQTPIVISNIGPTATTLLTRDENWSTLPAVSLPIATGLKTHILIDHSVIDHKGVMYCLDTQRIAGMVQPSNSDASLAPPGKHLLISHQLWRPERESIAAAREMAKRDLAMILGPIAENTWEILTMSQYHDAWPVNRAIQGRDTIPQTNIAGLYLVGDAVKPSGYLMVEGVAQSVNTMLDCVGQAGSAAPCHVAPKPSNRRAFTWLLRPPAPYQE